jgi:hypothetical protein
VSAKTAAHRAVKASACGGGEKVTLNGVAEPFKQSIRALATYIFSENFNKSFSVRQNLILRVCFSSYSTTKFPDCKYTRENILFFCVPQKQWAANFQKKF